MKKSKGSTEAWFCPKCGYAYPFLCGACFERHCLQCEVVFATVPKRVVNEVLRVNNTGGYKRPACSEACRAVLVLEHM